MNPVGLIHPSIFFSKITFTLTDLNRSSQPGHRSVHILHLRVVVIPHELACSATLYYME